MNTQFIILWFYFILLCTCVCLNEVSVFYKHIECALLPMGYVVYILQKNFKKGVVGGRGIG